MTKQDSRARRQHGSFRQQRHDRHGTHPHLVFLTLQPPFIPSNMSAPIPDLLSPPLGDEHAGESATQVALAAYSGGGPVTSPPSLTPNPLQPPLLASPRRSSLCPLGLLIISASDCEDAYSCRSRAHPRSVTRRVHRQTIGQRRLGDVQAKGHVEGYVSSFYPRSRLFPVVVRFKSIGSAPIMKNNVFKITAGNKFQAVIVFLRGQLGLKAGEPLVSVVGAQLLT